MSEFEAIRKSLRYILEHRYVYWREENDQEPGDDWCKRGSLANRCSSSRETLSMYIDKRRESAVTHLWITNGCLLNDQPSESLRKSIRHICVKSGARGWKDDTQLMKFLVQFSFLEELHLEGSSLDVDTLSLQLPSLKKLNISGNKLLNQDKLAEKLNCLMKLKELNLSTCELSEFPKGIQLSYLEKLSISGNRITNQNQLTEGLNGLRQLKEMNLSNCGLSALPEGLLLPCLEKLNASGNLFSNDKKLGQKLSGLKQLKDLNITGCELSEFPEGLQLPSLKKLSISGNELLNEDRLAEKLNCLWQLKELILSIIQLSSLEKLSISGNRITNLNQLTEGLNGLPQLKEMNLSNCGLSALPEGLLLPCLEKLNASGNVFGNDKKLGQKLSVLKLLTDLNISGCKLSEFPEGLQCLRNLETLSLVKNNMTEIPSWINDLPKLECLHLQGNRTLKRLNRCLNNSPLKTLDCTNCIDIVEPPYTICQGGITEIKQYYSDLALGAEELIVSTLAFIGRSMAGKSSMIKSIAKKELSKTDRTAAATDDQTTRVFDFVEISVGCEGNDPLSVNAIDFGGHEVYQYAYQMTFRDNCIPVVVVNIKDFENEANKFGRREATRRIVFDWIAHLYLSCTKLGSPILVLTHRDEYQDSEKEKENLKTLRKSLLQTIEDLKRELITDVGVGTDIDIFSDPDSPLFATEDIHEIGYSASSYESVFSGLENCLYKRLESHVASIPENWMTEIKMYRESKKPILHYHELDHSVRLDVILKYMKRSGDILWYPGRNEEQRRCEDFEDEIYHNMSRVTEVISTLFNHQASDILWNGTWSRGIITERNLHRLLSPEREIDLPIPSKIAVHLLRKFKLVFGPTVENGINSYSVPFFMPPRSSSIATSDIGLQVNMLFVGLSVPRYTYDQLTVAFATHVKQMAMHSAVQVYTYGDGSSAKIEGLKPIHAHLCHEVEDQRVILKVEGDVENVEECWRILLESVAQLREEVKRLWKAAQITYEVPCAHCRLLNQLHPYIHVNPDYLNPVGRRSMRSQQPDHFNSIPQPLIHPCENLDEDDQKHLLSYVRKYKPTEGDDIMSAHHECWENITTDPQPQTVFQFEYTVEKEYRMSATRGRVLIINNRAHAWQKTQLSNGFQLRWRKGSKHDYANLSRMFQRFGFVISDRSADRDWTSKEIVEAIHEETQLVDEHTTESIHRSLGMFALVIMSHGGNGTIAGCDGKDIQLLDIYKRLLSSTSFPAMAGKPKLVILQSCSGSDRERLDVGNRQLRQYPIDGAGYDISVFPPTDQCHCQYESHTTEIDTKPPAEQTVSREHELGENSATQVLTPNQDMNNTAMTMSHQTNSGVATPSPQHTNVPAGEPTAGGEALPIHDLPQSQLMETEEKIIGHGAAEAHLNIDDILVMKPSFEGHKSFRHRRRGSLFIRILVSAFYKLAGRKDLVSIGEVIQEQVRAESIRCTLEALEALDAGQENNQFGQIPVTMNTFTHGRKLYLYPGVKMRTENHPESITKPYLPPESERTTRVEWQADEKLVVKREGRRGEVKSKQKRFSVTRNQQNRR